MKKGIKIIIGGVGMAALLIIGLVAGGFFYIVYEDREIHQKNKQAESDGIEFGKTTDQNGCMEKMFTLPPTKIRFEMSTFKFIGGCLESSRPTPGFCKEVPVLYDAKWSEEQCKKVGHDTDNCIIAFDQKRAFCVRSNESKSK